MSSKTHGLNTLKAMDGAKPSMAEHSRSHTSNVCHHQAHFEFIILCLMIFSVVFLYHEKFGGVKKFFDNIRSGDDGQSIIDSAVLYALIRLEGFAVPLYAISKPVP